MAPFWQTFRENLFGLFYIMTEQSSVGSRENNWRIFRYTLLCLLDAGQVLKALFSKDYGWTSQVVGIMEKFDLLSLVNNVVFIALIAEVCRYFLANRLSTDSTPICSSWDFLHHRCHSCYTRTS